MSERNEKPLQAPEEGAQQASPPARGDAFQRAENRIAAGNEDAGARGREAVAGIENRPARDESPKRTATEASTQGATQDREASQAEQKANEKVTDDLAEKAREEGVEAAGQSSQIEWGLTPHNT
jgi:phage repressor protein C with HTH and peptisase S24 domain